MKGSSPQGNVASTSDDGTTLCSEVTMTNIHRKKFFNVWVLDTVVTWHMTSRKGWFSHYESFSGGSVFIVDDRPLKIVGKGIIKLRMYDGTIYTIQDV